MFTHYHLVPPDTPVSDCAMKYDTDLLEQIIETEIDIAAHKLQREKNLSVPLVVQHRWHAKLRGKMTSVISDECAGEHMVCPDVLQMTLKTMICDLMETDLTVEECVSSGGVVDPAAFSGITRFLLFLCPFHHKNRDI